MNVQEHLDDLLARNAVAKDPKGGSLTLSNLVLLQLAALIDHNSANMANNYHFSMESWTPMTLC